MSMSVRSRDLDWLITHYYHVHGNMIRLDDDHLKNVSYLGPLHFTSAVDNNLLDKNYGRNMSGVRSTRFGDPYYHVPDPYTLAFADAIRRKINRELRGKQAVAGMLANRVSSSDTSSLGVHFMVPLHNNLLDTKYGRYSSGVRSTRFGVPYDHVPEHYIDMPEGNMATYYAGGDSMMQKNNRGLMAPVVEQAVAGVLANRIAAGSDASLGVHFMEVAIVLGLSFKLAAAALQPYRRRKQQALSVWMAKIGDLTTAAAIIVSMGMHLPALMAWVAGPLAFLIIALALVFS